MKSKSVLLALICYLLIGCAVPVSVPVVEQSKVTKESPLMEFIGFKNLDQSNFLFASFASELEKTKIALNKQSYYVGNYSLQDLRLYKSNLQYITFVERVRSSYGHKDVVVDGKDGCNITFNGVFTIYVYDTKGQAIVWTKTIVVRENDDYVGSYYHKDTDIAAIDLHYRNIIYNALFEEYAKAYDSVSQLLANQQ